jgi:hypothetical protein
MTHPNPPALDEASRQRALDQYRILDTLPQGAYDDIVRVASAVCDTPVALVSLIDRDRQWFKARIGVDDVQTSRQVAVCDHAIREPGRLMEIPDLSRDMRFSDFPAVTGDPAARFYAGMPLVTPEGAAVGTVCVVDHAPRTLDARQRDALAALARLTVTLMESGRREHAQAATEALQPKPATDAAAATDFTVALLEVQDYAGLVARRGERATQRVLEELDTAFHAVLREHYDVLNRVTGSTEFVAVLHGEGRDAVLARLQAEAARWLASGLDVRIGSARSHSPTEAMPLVYLRADEALSTAKTERAD